MAWKGTTMRQDATNYRMTNLEAIARTFVGPAITVGDLGIDPPVIKAVHNKTLSKSLRADAIKTWFQKMRVLRGLTTDDRNNVIKAVLEFADRAYGCHFDDIPYADMLGRFRRLHGDCGEAVLRTSTDKVKDLTSLASKALWCCYPNAVPIYDSYAQNALWVISKLAPHVIDENKVKGQKYDQFATVWLEVYKQMEPVIRAEAHDSPYPYRVFDRMLWVMGQPDYSTKRVLANYSKDG